MGEGQLHRHFLLNDRQPEGSGDQTVARNVVLHNNKVCPGDQEEGIPETSGSGIVLLGRWTTSSAATSQSETSATLLCPVAPCEPNDLSCTVRVRQPHLPRGGCRNIRAWGAWGGSYSAACSCWADPLSARPAPPQRRSPTGQRPGLVSRGAVTWGSVRLAEMPARRRSSLGLSPVSVGLR